MPVWSFAAVVVAVLAGAGIGLSYGLRGDVSVSYCVLSLFLALNLLISYWELSLGLRQDLIAARAAYWRGRRAETGRSPAVAFLATRISGRQMLSLDCWADVWAVYASYDGSYLDRRSYGFNADFANGLLLLLPSLFLYVALTIHWLPAMVTGILGAMLFWHWLYSGSVYWLSFFGSGGHRPISRGEVLAYVWLPTAPWVLASMVGVYVSIRLIVDGNYSVL